MARMRRNKVSGREEIEQPSGSSLQGGGVLEDENSLEEAMGSKGTNHFFVESKTKPLGREGQKSHVCTESHFIRRGGPKSWRGEGWVSDQGWRLPMFVWQKTDEGWTLGSVWQTRNERIW